MRLHRKCNAEARHEKSDTPSIRVDPAFRETAEAVLETHERLSSFIETSLRASVARRQAKLAFLERGKAAAARARLTDDHIDDATVHTPLGQMLSKAKQRDAKP